MITSEKLSPAQPKLEEKNNGTSTDAVNGNQIQISRPVPPTLLRIYADNHDKRNLCIFWAVFFIVLVVMTIAANFLPKGLLQQTNLSQFNHTALQNCTNPLFNSNGTLGCYQNNIQKRGLVLLDMDPKNQFGIVYFRVKFEDINKTNKGKININLTLVLKDHKILQKQKQFERIQQRDTEEINVTLLAATSTEFYSDDGKQLIGYKYPVWVIRQFQKTSYAFIIEFETNISSIKEIKSIELASVVVNSKFTIYTIVIRYFFFTWSILGAVLYWIKYRKIPKDYRIFEQKLVGVLSILLIFFNDPVYPATVLTGSKVASYFSVLFVITFAIFLLFLWIMFIDRIYYEDGQKKTELLNWKRILYIIVTYILAIALYTEYAFDNLEGLPIVPAYDLAATKFFALQVISMILVLLGFGYIIVMYTRVCNQVDQKLWRNQLYMFFTLFFIVVTIVMFILNGFSVFSYHGSRILLLFTEMNMYTFYMQYMYSITPQEKQRIERGQLEQQNDGYRFSEEYRPGLQLLKNDGHKEDYVDLQFDEMPSGLLKIGLQKMNEMTEQQKTKLDEHKKYLKKTKTYKENSDDSNSDDENKPKNQKKPKKQADENFGEFDFE